MQSHGEDGEWPWIPLKAPNCWPPFFCILAGVPPRAANPPLQSRSAWTSHTHTHTNLIREGVNHLPWGAAGVGMKSKE